MVNNRNNKRNKNLLVYFKFKELPSLVYTEESNVF